MAVIQRLSVALRRRGLAIDIGILVAFWVVFYYRIWDGERHIGFDMDGYNFPLDHYISEGLRLAKTLPQWDWFTYNGSDFAGNIQSAMFYPPKIAFEWFLALCGIELSFPAYQFFVLLHVLAMSVFSYSVCRVLRVDRFWSCIAALTLTYTGVLQAQVEHFWFIGTLPWLPLVVYGAIELCRAKSRSAIVVYVIASVCMLLVGYPLQYATIQIEATIAALCVSVMESGFSPRRFFGSIGIIAASQIAVVGIGSVVLVPFLQLLNGSIADASGTWFPLQSALTILYPEAVGSLSGNFSLPSDRTTTYYYPGIILLLALAATALFGRFSKPQRKWLAVAGAIVVIDFIFLFTPTLSQLSSLLPAVAYIRPQTVGMPFAVALAFFCVGALVFAEKAAPVKLHKPIRIACAAACLTLFFNMPAFFSTPTGPASGVPSFVAGDIVDRSKLDLTRYSIAIDSHTAGDDPWARVLDTRFTGGFDPLAQRTYLDLLDAHKIHNEGRQTYFGDDADFGWLADNGVGFVMSDNPKIVALAKSSGWPAVQGPPNVHLYRLPHARPLATAPCATSVDAQFQTNRIVVNYAMPKMTCPIRLTTNYSPYFSAGSNESVTPVAGELGMEVSAPAERSGAITLTYSNWAYIRGFYVSAVSLALCTGVLLLLLAKRSSPRVR